MQEMKTGQQVWRGEGVLSEQVWTGLGGEARAGARCPHAVENGDWLEAGCPQVNRFE